MTDLLGQIARARANLMLRGRYADTLVLGPRTAAALRAAVPGAFEAMPVCASAFDLRRREMVLGMRVEIDDAIEGFVVSSDQPQQAV